MSKKELDASPTVIDINHVMKLAKLDLNDADTGHFSMELNKILDYINMLKGADTSSLTDIANDLDYDNLTSGRSIETDFYKDCRQDVCAVDESFDFKVVKKNAPSFEIVESIADGDEENSSITGNTVDRGRDAISGFFVVPQIIE